MVFWIQKFSVEDVVNEVMSMENEDYAKYLINGMNAFEEKNIRGIHNPYWQLIPLFNYLEKSWLYHWQDHISVEDLNMDKERGKPDKLSHSDVFALYGYIKSFHDSTTGFLALINGQRFFGKNNWYKRRLPDSGEFKDYMIRYHPLLTKES